MIKDHVAGMTVLDEIQETHTIHSDPVLYCEGPPAYLMFQVVPAEVSSCCTLPFPSHLFGLSTLTFTLLSLSARSFHAHSRVTNPFRHLG